ncbi:hypothetical protein HD806DRAFT_477497, partial [Xylariaceae sp. AK1471]
MPRVHVCSVRSLLIARRQCENNQRICRTLMVYPYLALTAHSSPVSLNTMISRVYKHCGSCLDSHDAFHSPFHGVVCFLLFSLVLMDPLCLQSAPTAPILGRKCRDGEERDSSMERRLCGLALGSGIMLLARQCSRGGLVSYDRAADVIYLW